MHKLFAAVTLALVTQGALGVAVWGQCGGTGYSGSTVCDSGSTCVYSNPYYSQCQPGTASTTAKSTSTSSKSTTTVSTGPTTTSSTAPAGPTPPQGYSQITANVGSNPNNVGLYVYKPKVLANPPPLIVASHYCTGTAEAYYTSTKYAQLAETHGYYVIYPSSPRSGGCWDVNTNATLTHNGGSDSLGIVNAVRYAIANWGVDKTRVFATGSSSGAMLTSVFMGAYPDVFKAGAVDSGVAYGCFEGPNAWNSQCAEGDLIQTGQQWANLVYAGYPGYTGPRPSVQVWHGTIDTTLYPQNFWEEIKQWTTVFGYSSTPVSNVSMVSEGFPAGYSNATYGPKFQAILAQNVGHTVPVFETNILAFFGI